MVNVELFATIMFVVQLVHSLEELKTGFHKKWFLFKMPFWVFFTFEIVHNLFWGSVLLFKSFPSREYFLVLFIVLMFANGVEHLVWWAFVKKYVPGLITAPIHVVLFLVFCYLAIGLRRPPKSPRPIFLTLNL